VKKIGGPRGLIISADTLAGKGVGGYHSTAHVGGEKDATLRL
jgi:hypothetical protein